jgi:hypothetical protein
MATPYSIQKLTYTQALLTKSLRTCRGYKNHWNKMRAHLYRGQ